MFFQLAMIFSTLLGQYNYKVVQLLNFVIVCAEQSELNFLRLIERQSHDCMLVYEIITIFFKTSNIVIQLKLLGNITQIVSTPFQFFERYPREPEPN